MKNFLETDSFLYHNFHPNFRLLPSLLKNYKKYLRSHERLETYLKSFKIQNELSDNLEELKN